VCFCGERGGGGGRAAVYPPGKGVYILIRVCDNFNLNSGFCSFRHLTGNV